MSKMPLGVSGKVRPPTDTEFTCSKQWRGWVGRRQPAHFSLRAVSSPPPPAPPSTSPRSSPHLRLPVRLRGQRHVDGGARVVRRVCEAQRQLAVLPRRLQVDACSRRRRGQGRVVALPVEDPLALARLQQLRGALPYQRLVRPAPSLPLHRPSPGSPKMGASSAPSATICWKIVGMSAVQCRVRGPWWGPRQQ